MEFSPEDVEHYEFLLSVPGYNRAEVRAFLQAVAAQLRQTDVIDASRLEDPIDGVEPEIQGEAERAIGELIRAAEIHIEDVANRVVGEFETVRAEISQLLRLLDQRSSELASIVRPPEEPIDLDVVEEQEEDPEPAHPQPENEEFVDEASEEGGEMPPEWDDLFVEPKMDSSP